VTSAAGDLAACRDTLARGSKSFHLAWRLLPARLRDPFASFYSFCRVTDDAVDESTDASAALERCVARTDAIFADRPEDHPIDRAFARTVAEHALPRAPVDALLDGYRWDVEKRVVRTRSDLVAYAVRVAASVGVASTYLMGVRDRSTLARAADLGVAMQLTNVARDVGDDARHGRTYLPAEWLDEERVGVLGPEVHHSAALGRVVRRVLDDASVLYARADSGIARLPADARPAIRAASQLYREIGQILRENGYDAVSRRASTTPVRKAFVLARSLAEPLHFVAPSTEVLPEAELLLPRSS
jgi:phytoene synthase